jgi:hypothetical protein
MARAIVAKQRPTYEPLYDIDPRNGASIEVFYADRVLAESFSRRGAGWCWWSCQPGCLPDGPPSCSSAIPRSRVPRDILASRSMTHSRWPNRLTCNL